MPRNISRSGMWLSCLGEPDRYLRGSSSLRFHKCDRSDYQQSAAIFWHHEVAEAGGGISAMNRALLLGMNWRCLSALGMHIPRIRAEAGIRVRFRGVNPGNRQQKRPERTPTDLDQFLYCTWPRPLRDTDVFVDVTNAMPAQTRHHHRPLLAWVKSISSGRDITKSHGTAATAIAAFYAALHSGDGKLASAFVVPEMTRKVRSALKR
ncbi:hypothetical protein J2X71_003347 [Rhizobium sp. 1399]|nr:hypothetical protein [Rhizobium sp. 1399]